MLLMQRKEYKKVRQNQQAKRTEQSQLKSAEIRRQREEKQRK
jgi:hypothetical protein